MLYNLLIINYLHNYFCLYMYAYIIKGKSNYILYTKYRIIYTKYSKNISFCSVLLFYYSYCSIIRILFTIFLLC